jgi:hypothetical protein
MNFTTTDGQFNARIRRLQTMTISFNETAQRFVVRNDSDDRLCGSGFVSVDEAVKSCKNEDERRYRIW